MEKLYSGHYSFLAELNPAYTLLLKGDSIVNILLLWFQDFWTRAESCRPAQKMKWLAYSQLRRLLTTSRLSSPYITDSKVAIKYEHSRELLTCKIKDKTHGLVLPKYYHFCLCSLPALQKSRTLIYWNCYNLSSCGDQFVSLLKEGVCQILRHWSVLYHGCWLVRIAIEVTSLYD